MISHEQLQVLLLLLVSFYLFYISLKYVYKWFIQHYIILFILVSIAIYNIYIIFTQESYASSRVRPYDQENKSTRPRK